MLCKTFINLAKNIVEKIVDNSTEKSQINFDLVTGCFENLNVRSNIYGNFF